jgi:SAM-dependent methyltransferase
VTLLLNTNALPARIARYAQRRLGIARYRPPADVAFEPGGALPSVHHTRSVIANVYLRGEGIEIGALHQPLPVPESVRVKYIDRMTAAELQRHYPEIASTPFVETDIVDNGEELTTIADNSQDFVIANHFIEHCQNPIRTLENFLRVLKTSGVLYLAVPEKRFTFDVRRPPTPIDHILRDHREGPAWSRRQHFEEWVRLVEGQPEEQVESRLQQLLDMDYSIHYHVWEAPGLLELVATLQRMLRFELELFLRNGFETIVILRKVAA